jgi:hypothetical protein
MLSQEDGEEHEQRHVHRERNVLHHERVRLSRDGVTRGRGW